MYPDGTNDKVYLRHLAFYHDEAKIWLFLRTCTPNVHPNFNYLDEATLLLCYILNHYVFMQIVVRQPSFFCIYAYKSMPIQDGIIVKGHDTVPLKCYAGCLWLL